MEKPSKRDFFEARVTLKRIIWNGTRKVPSGTVFIDHECFEGKYQPGTADVVLLEPQKEITPKISVEEEITQIETYLKDKAHPGRPSQIEVEKKERLEYLIKKRDSGE